MLTPAQEEEALGILQEEASEVIKEASKVRRSGKDFRPFGGATTNQQHLQNEVWDFVILAELMGLSLIPTPEFREQKMASLAQWSTLLDGDENAR